MKGPIKRPNLTSFSILDYTTTEFSLVLLRFVHMREQCLLLQWTHSCLSLQFFFMYIPLTYRRPNNSLWGTEIVVEPFLEMYF